MVKNAVPLGGTDLLKSEKLTNGSAHHLFPENVASVAADVCVRDPAQRD